MNQIVMFTDAATSPQAMVSIGAYVCLDHQHVEEYTTYSVKHLLNKLADIVVYNEYKSKKSTWSEIKTVIDALNIVWKNLGSDIKVDLYTDCQSLCDLLGQRKQKLIQSAFRTRSGKILQNAALYDELFAITENFPIQVFKLKGHRSKTCILTGEERIFKALDILSRKKLRVILQNSNYILTEKS